MANFIEVYRKNDLTINCTVSGLATLEGFTAKLMVKDNILDSDDSKKFELTGTVNGLVLTFAATAENNNLTPDRYFYEVYIIDGETKHTVTRDTYTVLDVVRD